MYFNNNINETELKSEENMRFQNHGPNKSSKWKEILEDAMQWIWEARLQ